MKTELSAADLHFLARELQSLIGAKVDKIYEKKDDLKDFLFTFHKSGDGKSMLRIKLPSLAYLTQSKPDFPQTPPGFCVFLRKYLTNARITKLEQHEFERILKIEFDTKDGKKTLIIELFSKGNMVMIDENQKIKGLLESQNWESRTIRGGAKYEYPPLQTNAKQITREEFENIITKSNMESIVKTFAVELSLGGFFAEELCRRANISKDKKRLNPNEIDSSFVELKKLFLEKISANKKENEILPIISKEGFSEKYESFSEAIDANLTEKIESKQDEAKLKEKNTKKKKTEVLIEKQKERLTELEKEVQESQRKGELIYENYAKIKSLLENINIDRKKMTWQEIKEKYSELIIDEKKGLIIIDL